jgi:transcriptional regulator with XRE-family HTH domain
MSTAMDPRAEIRSFLTSRRAKLSPQDAGVPVFGGVRRVPGLRREEVAHLAGVSVDYYSRLERGRTDGVSPEVLAAVARALQLDEDEREHLSDLVRLSQRRVPRGGSSRSSIRAGLQRVMDAIDAPSFVQNARLDRLSANHLGRALYGLPADGSDDRFNYAEFLFLDPRAREFHRDYDLAARNSVALLHTASGKDPFDQELISLIGTLSTRSDLFRTLWASHDVHRYRAGAKVFTHSLVGDLEFGYESFELPTDPGLVMLVYSMEPGTRTEEAMRLLSSWSADAPAQSTAEHDAHQGLPDH